MDGTIHAAPKDRRLTGHVRERLIRHGLQEPFNPVDAISESYVFVPLELGFQVQALAGELQAEDNGKFSVRFFVKVGESDAACHRVHIGGESVVILKNLRVFLASLHEALAA